MSTNNLDIQERIHIGKKNEAYTLEILKLVKPWNLSWEPSSKNDDKNKKIDAWARNDGEIFSAQLKYRESGNDLGIAVIRPFEDLASFRTQYRMGSLNYDRDYQRPVDLYVCRAGNQLLVCWYTVIHEVCEQALYGLYTHGFSDQKDYELKLVTDKGQGYTAGQQKLICYIPFKKLIDKGAYLKVKGE